MPLKLSAQRRAPSRPRGAAWSIDRAAHHEHRIVVGCLTASGARARPTGSAPRSNSPTAAILDRLLHRATVLQIDGDSYRMRTTAPASPPSEPASTIQPKVGNSHDRNWGILTIVDNRAGLAAMVLRMRRAAIATLVLVGVATSGGSVHAGSYVPCGRFTEAAAGEHGAFVGPYRSAAPSNALARRGSRSTSSPTSKDGTARSRLRRPGRVRPGPRLTNWRAIPAGVAAQVEAGEAASKAQHSSLGLSRPHSDACSAGEAARASPSGTPGASFQIRKLHRHCAVIPRGLRGWQQPSATVSPA